MTNLVVLHGRLTADPELRTAESGKKVVRFTLAVAGNSAKAPTEFIPVVAFDTKAENIAKYTQKGSEVVIEAHIHPSSHEGKDGKKHYNNDIVIDTCTFAGKKPAQDKPADADEATDADTTDAYIEDDLEPNL